jgi:hypothetical protein
MPWLMSLKLKLAEVLVTVKMYVLTTTSTEAGFDFAKAGFFAGSASVMIYG